MAKNSTPQTVLVCEDDPLVSQYVADVLEEAGYSTARARNGDEAVRLAAELLPSLIALDLDLPQMDGVKVMHRLQANGATAQIPVVVVSANPGWLTFVERQRAAAVIQKPFLPSELQMVVDQTLTKRSMV